MCKRGDIYYVDFGSNTDRRKQNGVRPAMVISNNRANEHSPVITVVPADCPYLQKAFHAHPCVCVPRCGGSGLSKNSLALAEQVEAIIEPASGA